MSQAFTVLITYDEPSCAGAAEALRPQLQQREADLRTEVRCVSQAVSDGGTHREAVYAGLQQLFHVKHERLFVVCLMRDDAAQDYRRVREVCAATKPAINNVLALTSLESYSDVSLVLRNVVRRVSAAVP